MHPSAYVRRMTPTGSLAGPTPYNDKCKRTRQQQCHDNLRESYNARNGVNGRSTAVWLSPEMGRPIASLSQQADSRKNTVSRVPSTRSSVLDPLSVSHTRCHGVCLNSQSTRYTSKHPNTTEDRGSTMLARFYYYAARCSKVLIVHSQDSPCLKCLTIQNAVPNLVRTCPFGRNTGGCPSII